MAMYDEGLKHTTYIAGADFQTTATNNYVGLALKQDADGEVTLNGQHGVPVGFLDLAPEGGVGTPLTVLVQAYRHGAIASEAIAVGDLVNTEANGRLGKAANPSRWRNPVHLRTSRFGCGRGRGRVPGCAGPIRRMGVRRLRK